MFAACFDLLASAVILAGMIPHWRNLLLAILISAAEQAHGQQRPSAIHVMRADGSEARRLVEVEGHSDQEAPRWSRDGKQILFDATSPNSGARDLFVVNADGTGLRKLGPARAAIGPPTTNKSHSSTIGRFSSRTWMDKVATR